MKNFVGLFLSLIFCIGYSANSQPLRNINQTETKLYSQMSESEKNQFVAEQADKILEKFGRATGDKVNEKGLKLIRNFVDSYVKRQSLPKSDSCRFGSDLSSVLLRANKYIKTISDEFSGQSLVSQTGIYTAMIESEFCPCLQAPTGALGMFQFSFATGSIYGLKTVKGANPQKPDERCNPQLAARAAAKYIKYMIADKFDNQTDSIGYLLAISSYNSGEGATKKHIQAITVLNGKPKVTFWDFLDTADAIAKKPDTGFMNQFQTENFKYVPKFFAAAIIGENPRVFGIDINPLSSSQ